MRLFWPLYASVAVIGTALIYCCTPRRSAPHPNPVPPSAPPADPSAPTTHPATPTTQPPNPVAPVAPPPNPAAPSAPPPNLVAPVALPTGGAWGVTHRDTSFYSPSGENQGTLPAGTAFLKWSVHVSSRGRMLAVTPYHPGSDNAPTSLLASVSAVLFTGSPSDLPEAQYAALTNYYALGGKIAAHRAEQQQAVASQSPHYEEATRLYKRYQAFLEESRDIARKRNRAVGPERTRLENLLTARKTDEARLATATKAANEKYKEWKELNKSLFDAIHDDALVESWQAEREKLRSEIPSLAIPQTP